MSFRATKPNGYDEAKSIAAELKRLCQDTKAATAAGPVSANVIRQLYDRLLSAKARFAIIAAIPGIGAYAQQQEGDPLYDVAAKFTAMTTEINDTINWIIGAIPTGTGGLVLLETWTTSGVSVRTFTTAQTAGLRTELDALIATID
jgi:hypothetical protein